MIFIIFEKLVAVCGKLEEISFLTLICNKSAAIGALAVNCLSFSPEGFAGLAVKTLIIALVNIALFLHFGEYLLNCLFVVIIGGTDELIV